MPKSTCIGLLLLLALLTTLANSTSGSTSGHAKSKQNNSIKRSFEDISGDGRYLVQWEVDFDSSIITFDVIAETKGFVGFGISATGSMNGADIFVGGVNGDGTTYASDMHGVGNAAPVVDDQQDWTLISASETATHTNLRFSRALDTCDKEHDVAITPDTTRIIWSLGTTDQLAYHGANRGAYAVNLLDPPMPPVDTSQFDSWRIATSLEMPAAQTTYWCTIHKSPSSYRERRHVVGFNTILETPDSKAHTHHLGVFKCTPPPGETHEFFEQFLGVGDDCYAQRPKIPVEYCRTTLYIWAVGGKPLFLSEHIGYPILEDTAVEYLMMDVHYNNPSQMAGVQVPTAVELFSTTQLRPIDADIMTLDHPVSYSNLIPPGVQNFVQVAHCSPECTAASLKPEGIKLVNLMFHAHLLGRKMKLRHFRGGSELPWIGVDDTYDFDFQQSRPLREEISLFPGDQLTLECTYNSMGMSGVTIGGYQTEQEMCTGVLWYYPKSVGRLGCESGYNGTKLLQRFGIEAISQSTPLDPPIVTAPAEHAGKTFTQVVDGLVNYWTPERLDEFQREVISEHVDKCGTTVVRYPVVDEEYAPPVQTCEPPRPQSCGFFGDYSANIKETHPTNDPIASIPMFNVDYAFIRSTFLTSQTTQVGDVSTLDIFVTPTFADYVDLARQSFMDVQQGIVFRCVDGSVETLPNFNIQISDENTRAPTFTANNYAFNVTLPWPEQIPITLNNPIVVRDLDYDVSNSNIRASLYPTNLLDLTLTPRGQHEVVPDARIDLFVKAGLSAGTHTLLITASDGVHDTIVPIIVQVTQATCPAAPHAQSQSRDPVFGSKGSKSSPLYFKATIDHVPKVGEVLRLDIEPKVEAFDPDELYKVDITTDADFLAINEFGHVVFTRELTLLEFEAMRSGGGLIYEIRAAQQVPKDGKFARVPLIISVGKFNQINNIE